MNFDKLGSNCDKCKVKNFLIGMLSIQIVDYEQKRWDAWDREVREGDEPTTRLTFAIRKQQQFIESIRILRLLRFIIDFDCGFGHFQSIAPCLNLLLNLAEDIKVEMKIVD